ncbi:T9SS type A sorting domain-containing protein [Bacteroidota bacterium]
MRKQRGGLLFKNKEIAIHNLLGELVLTVLLTGDATQRIDISRLAAGAYILHIGGKSRVFMKE